MPTSTSVSASAEAELGSTLSTNVTDSGSRTWIYVLNEGSGLGTIQVGSGASVSDTEALTTGGVEVGSVIKFAAGTTAPACIFGIAVAGISASGTGNAFFDCRG